VNVDFGGICHLIRSISSAYNIPNVELISLRRRTCQISGFISWWYEVMYSVSREPGFFWLDL